MFCFVFGEFSMRKPVFFASETPLSCCGGVSPMNWVVHASLMLLIEEIHRLSIQSPFLSFGHLFSL